MRKNLVTYEEAVSHIRLCNRSLLDFSEIYEENFVFFFIRERDGTEVALASFLSASLVGSRGCGGAAAGWTAG